MATGGRTSEVPPLARHGIGGESGLQAVLPVILEVNCMTALSKGEVTGEVSENEGVSTATVTLAVVLPFVLRPYEVPRKGGQAIQGISTTIKIAFPSTEGGPAPTVCATITARRRLKKNRETRTCGPQSVGSIYFRVVSRPVGQGTVRGTVLGARRRPEAFRLSRMPQGRESQGVQGGRRTEKGTTRRIGKKTNVLVYDVIVCVVLPLYSVLRPYGIFLGRIGHSKVTRPRAGLPIEAAFV